jgi:hypothetical protein
VSDTLECTDELVKSPDPVHQDWLDRCRELAKAGSNLQFDIGDLLAEGEDRWSREIAYDEACVIFHDYTRASLQTLVSVARSVKPLIRVKDLSWAHHRAVAKLAKSPETQRELLAHAAENGMLVADFREYVKAKHPSKKPKHREEKFRVTFEPSAEVYEYLEAKSFEWNMAIGLVANALIEQARLQSVEEEGRP